MLMTYFGVHIARLYCSDPNSRSSSNDYLIFIWIRPKKSYSPQDIGSPEIVARAQLRTQHFTSCRYLLTCYSGTCDSLRKAAKKFRLLGPSSPPRSGLMAILFWGFFSRSKSYFFLVTLPPPPSLLSGRSKKKLFCVLPM